MLQLILYKEALKWIEVASGAQWIEVASGAQWMEVASGAQCEFRMMAFGVLFLHQMKCYSKCLKVGAAPASAAF